jgi:hypothetical protein
MQHVDITIVSSDTMRNYIKSIARSMQQSCLYKSRALPFTCVGPWRGSQGSSILDLRTTSQVSWTPYFKVLGIWIMSSYL